MSVDLRDWTVEFRSRKAGARDEAYPVTTVSKCGDAQYRQDWSISTTLKLAKEVTETTALLFYGRYHRRWLRRIVSGGVPEAHWPVLTDQDWELCQAGTSGDPQVLVAEELEVLLWHLNSSAFNGINHGWPRVAAWVENQVNLEDHSGYEAIGRFYSEYQTAMRKRADGPALRQLIQRGNIAFQELRLQPAVSRHSEAKEPHPVSVPNAREVPKVKAKTWRDRYKLTDPPIGTGGQADVFRASEIATGKVVALKRLHNVKDSGAVARLRREVEILSSVHHPNVMPLYQTSEFFDWYTMPLASRHLLKEALPLTPELLRTIVISSAKALIAGHNANAIHRDVSPANIFCIEQDGSPEWVLGDWGLVRRPGLTTVANTKAGGQFGTLGFAAPETWTDAHNVDRRADIYSLGRVVAWAVTGIFPEQNRDLPVDGPWSSFADIATKHEAKDRPESVESLLTYVPTDAVSGTVTASKAVDVELSFEKNPEKSDNSVHHYEMSVWLENTIKVSIEKWHVDLCLPRSLLNAPTNYARLVEEQSDENNAVLRATADSAQGTLYPRDRRCVLKVEYHVDQEMYRRRHELFVLPIIARAFALGEESELRRTVEEFQNF
jgi:serine/threonine protein kinase